MGRPWDLAKAFDHSAPMAPLVAMDQVTSVETGRIWLKVNGEVKQDADLADLIWPVKDHIATLSEAMELAAGDLIMTGTPAGVGAVKPGDRMQGGVDGIATLDVTVGPAR